MSSSHFNENEYFRFEKQSSLSSGHPEWNVTTEIQTMHDLDFIQTSFKGTYSNKYFEQTPNKMTTYVWFNVKRKGSYAMWTIVLPTFFLGHLCD